MDPSNLPRIEIEVETPKPLQILLNTAHIPTFPFLSVKFEKGDDTLEVNVRASEEIYNQLVSAFGGDRTILYYDLPKRTAGLWTSAMMRSILALIDLDLMSDIERWTIVSRHYLRAVIANTKMETPTATEKTNQALALSREILATSGLLSEVQKLEQVVGVARDVLLSGFKDLDSTVYRIAMAIYHSKRLTGQELVPGVEDSAAIYLALTQATELLTKHRALEETLRSVPAPEKNEFTRTFICFVIGVYACNKALAENAGENR